MKKELVTHLVPKSPVSETFRTLRTNIQFMNSNIKLRTLLVTSTVPGEGKSWVTANLAVTFAQAGKRVVLIDADMRKGRLYSIFKVQPRPGLSNYLSKYSDDTNHLDLNDYVVPTEVENLYIMPAGNVPPNPSELLVTRQMRNLLDELKRKVDLIIIDGTPCKLVTDSIILSRMVDSTMIVSAHNETRKDDLERVVRDIKNVGGRVIGVVYNKLPITSRKYTKAYYYSSNSSGVKVPSDSDIERKKIQQRTKNIMSQNNDSKHHNKKSNREDIDDWRKILNEDRNKENSEN